MNSLRWIFFSALCLFLCFSFKASASTVVTWGQTNNFGLGNVPANLTNAVALAAGNSHSVALKADGRVVVWGSNSAGETNVPASVSNVVAIAAGWQHTIALRSNGTVVGWGTGGTIVPPGLSNLIAIAAGDYHNLGLKTNGTVVAWGDGGFIGTVTNVPPGLSNVVGIAATGDTSIALKADGTLVKWGSVSGPSIAGLSNVAAIAAGEFPLVTLKADGTVTFATPPPGLSNVVAVAAGRYHGIGLKLDGTVVTWAGAPNPIPPATLSNVVAIASGQNHCLALVGDGAPRVSTPMLNRTVFPGSTVPFYVSAIGEWPLSYQWRSNNVDIPGATGPILALTNVLPSSSGNYAVVVANTSGSVTSSVVVLTVIDFSDALNTTGLEWTTTGNAQWFVESNVTHDGVSALQSGQITNNQSTTLQTMVTGPGTLTFWWKVSSPPGDAPLRFLIGNSQLASIAGNVDWQQKTFYLGEGTQVLKWIFQKGGNAYAGSYSGWLDEVSFVPGTTAPIFTSLPVSQSQAPNFKVVLSATATGTPPLNYQWQLNSTNLPGATSSSLTLGNLQQSNFGPYSLIVTNAGGMTNADAILESGQVAAWNDEFFGGYPVPTGMTKLIAIAAGNSHGLALKSNGTIAGWGNNPFVPPDLTNVIAISSGAGANYSLALKRDGTVVAWGSNNFGETNLPPNLTNVVAIAAGWSHGLALKADGTAVGWGYNSHGQADVPAGLSNIVAIAGGHSHSMAITADGHVTVWGNPGTTNVPPGLTNALSVAGGLFYCSAVKGDGTLAAWGDNSYGQTNIPPNVTNASSVAAGWYHAIATTRDGNVFACDTSSSVPGGFTNVMAVASGQFYNLALEGNSSPVLQAPFSSPNMDANGFSVSLPTQSGKVYLLEYKNSLSDSSWTALPLVGGNGGVITLTDPEAGANSQRFYRVRQW